MIVPPRPPALCPGCPHRAFFYAMSMNKRRAVISGDIGCYSMGVLPPFQAMDMLISMGASIGMAHGFKQAGGQEAVVATIGDSTFFHSGMGPLASAVYNKSNIVVAVLDNRITAMTGQQHNPGTGTTLQGAEGTHIDIADVVRAMGVTYVEEIDAWEVNKMNKAIRAAMKHEDGPAVAYRARRVRLHAALPSISRGCRSITTNASPAARASASVAPPSSRAT